MKDVTPLHQQWSYVCLALTHWYYPPYTLKSWKTLIFIGWLLWALCRAANPSANPSGTLQNFFRDIHKISGTFFHDNFMGQICILHFENMLPPFAKLHLVSARATAGACELLQRFVALFGFNWRSFSRKKLRRFDQVWMKFYILNMSLRADTDGKMRCMCEICTHEYISTKLVISVIFEVSSVLRNFSTLPVSCPGNTGTVGSSDFG